MEKITTDPNDSGLGHDFDNKKAEQNEKYLVLSKEERDKGFVRSVRLSYVHKTCKSETTMNKEIAETYARNPKFYGSTYCIVCEMHRPIEEFTWSGTDEVVGS